jgi:choline dehydrogenase-like flavoprotein
MIIDGTTLHNGYMADADAVVVGSGAGGAPMAYHLAYAGMKVILLEEGNHHQPAAFNRDIWKAAEQMYRDKAAFFTIGAPPIPLPLGRTLGGTTVINSGTCFRLPEKVFNKWKREYGLSGFEYQELLPVFDYLEQYLNVTDTPFELMGAHNKLFYEGAKKIGLSPKPIKRNQRNCRGAGLCVFGCPNQAKLSMEQSFIPDASAQGALIITNARVEKILTQHKAATGVEGNFLNAERKPLGTFSIHAPVVILCCGAIFTPYLLLKNKLANSSGQVGKNLRIHPAAKVIAFFDEDIKSWQGVPQALYVDDYAQEGIMFEGFFLPPSFLSIALPASGHLLKAYMAQYNKMAGFGIMVTDTSHGRIRLGPADTPLVFYNLNEEDTRKFVKGIEIACRIFFEAGAKKILTPIHGMPPFINIEQLKMLYARKIKPTDLELSAFHPLGTCRMGDNPKLSVVNASQETHDIKGLFIADASVFPSGLGVNPQISIMSFSIRTAQYIIKNKTTSGIKKSSHEI